MKSTLPFPRSPQVQHKTLTGIFRFDLMIDGIENEADAGAVQLAFHDGSILEMELVPDGESVRYTWKTQQVAFKESGWMRLDLSERRPFASLCGQRIHANDILLFGDYFEQKADMLVAAYRFQFEEGQSLVYYNAGDFARMYVNELPPDPGEQFVWMWEEGSMAIVPD